MYYGMSIVTYLQIPNIQLFISQDPGRTSVEKSAFGFKGIDRELVTIKPIGDIFMICF